MALTTSTLDIPAGQSLSNGLQCLGPSGRIVRIGMPTTWTPASLTFQVSLDGTDYLDLFHIQITTGAFTPYEAIVPGPVAGTALLLPPDVGFYVNWLKIRSGSRAQPVVQTGLRTFTVVFSS